MTKEKITRSELKEKRTANRKVFENQDHSRTVEIYMEPVHYEDEDGSWKEMDDTLEEVAFGRSIGGTGNRKFCNNKRQAGDSADGQCRTGSNGITYNGHLCSTMGNGRCSGFC